MNSPTLKQLILAAALLALPLANGCMWAPELTEVKSDIARQLPDVGFRKNVTLSFGPLTMVLARTITGLIPDAGEARAYLRDVSKVQVAIYEIDGTPEGTAVETPARLQELLDEGWEMAVRVREEHEVVWLLYRLDDESVREMFVVVMSDDELVLVKVKGRLERLLAEALEHARDEGGFMRGSPDIEL
ncbi:MAG TPA: DUF4252 domain-containing protein [Candidatus Krumholzibacteria bacterium]|nr:DUF4252 domain-containing protein [Candidatus Krumholzibacteria bacterium]